MRCPSCHYEQPDNHTSCEACGLIFSKYEEAHELPAPVYYGKPRPYLWGAILFSLATAGCLWDSFSYLTAQKAEGQVVGWTSYKSRSMKAPSGAYAPRVQFTLPGGKGT